MIIYSSGDVYEGVFETYKLLAEIRKYLSRIKKYCFKKWNWSLPVVIVNVISLVLRCGTRAFHLC